MKPRSIAAHVLAFLLPPGIVGLLAILTVVKGTLLHREPKPAGFSRETPTGLAFPSVQLESGPKARPIALIVLSNQGTSAQDLFTTTEALGRSGLWQIVTAAPLRHLSATTGGVSILPDYSLDQAPKPDLLVLPGVIDPNHPQLLAEVKRLGPLAKAGILAPGEGVRLAGLAGFLRGQEATAPLLSLEALNQTPKNSGEAAPKILPEAWSVESGSVITSAGGPAVLDATLVAIRNQGGEALAQRVAQQLGWRYPAPSHRDSPLPSRLDYGRLILNAGFDWGRRTVGVWLSPGMPELALGAWLETPRRSLSVETTSLAPERTFVRTLHGLTLVAQDPAADAYPPDLLLADSSAKLPANVLAWEQNLGIPIVKISDAPSASHFSLALQKLSDLDGPEIARIVARLQEMEEPAALQGLEKPLIPKKTLWLSLRILLLGTLGILLFRSLLRGILPSKGSNQTQFR